MSVLLDPTSEELLLASYLRILQAQVADLVQSCADDAALRKFACSCARMAIGFAHVENNLLLDILSQAEAFTEGTANRAKLDAAASIAERLVEDFEANEFGDDDDVDDDTYRRAFDAARAANAVYGCTARSAKCAAAFACYETESIGDVKTASEICEKTRQMAIVLLSGNGERASAPENSVNDE
jgi:hypothetical protein